MVATAARSPAVPCTVSDAEEDSWSRRMRYLKVGAAAMGGGALFAVTGGLAAPAIAAGLMSILPAIGAPAIVASSVAGLGTAGGVAFTTSECVVCGGQLGCMESRCSWPAPALAMPALTPGPGG